MSEEATTSSGVQPPAMDEVLELLRCAAPAAAAREGEGDDVQFLLVELPRDAKLDTTHDRQGGESEVVLHDLHTSTPTLQIGEKAHPAEFAEDVGSTLVFDRAALRRIAESGSESEQRRPEQRRRPPQDSLVCVTTKRLRPSGGN